MGVELDLVEGEVHAGQIARRRRNGHVHLRLRLAVAVVQSLEMGTGERLGRDLVGLMDPELLELEERQRQADVDHALARRAGAGRVSPSSVCLSASEAFGGSTVTTR